MAYSLDYYKKQEKKVMAQIQREKKSNKKLDDEIDELQRAYDKLGKIKRNHAQSVKDMAKLDKIAGDAKWRGHEKNKFDDTVNDHVKKDAKRFYESIDAIQDEIGKAIDKKKGQKYNKLGVISNLNKTLINIRGSIRNLFN